MKLLVFPIDCESDVALFRTMEKLGVEVFGASATENRRFLGKDAFALPYITDEKFEEELLSLVEDHSITHLYTSHSGVWEAFSEDGSRPFGRVPVTLCSEFPFEEAYNQFKPFLSWGESVHNRLSQEKAPQGLSAVQLASLCFHFNKIPGQSDNQKLEALLSLAPEIPEGTWLEIGSLYGKSSYALGYLANIYNGADLVCVDPWDLDKVLPQEGKAAILDKHAKFVDLDKVFEIFKCSIALLDNVTYIRDRSEDALPRFLNSEFDGRKLACEHSIALLHIDGSHHFDEVSKDITLWEPLVCVGGWVAVDDYLWAFGDGPKRAGDNLLKTGRFDTAFVAGDTLYLRKAFL